MTGDTTLTTCGKCLLNLTEGQDTVTCFQCKTLYHLKCVQVDDNMNNWICPTCAKPHLNLPTTSVPSVKSSSHHSKASSRVRLLEEQKRVLEEQEQLIVLEIEAKKKAGEEEIRMYKEMIEKQRQSAEDLQKTFQKRKEILEQKSKLVDEAIISLSSGSQGSIHSVAQSKEKVENWIERNSALMVENENKLSSPMCSKMLHSQLPSSTMHQIPSADVDINVDKKQVYINPARTDHIHADLSKNQIAARHIVKQLPTFDGNPKEWARFLSSFNRSTDLCGFSNGENLERLRQSLRGSALEAVEGRLSSGMVSSILKDLKSLFGRPEFIINELLKDLRGEPNPSLDNLDSIIRYSFQVENICGSMRDAKLSEHLWIQIY